MSDWKLPWSASCLCGQVQMRVTKAPIFSAACHCRGCQKLSGGAYSLTMMLAPDGFEKLSGDTEIGGLHRPEIQHHHCTHCKNWIYTTGALLGGNVNVRPTMLEDVSWFVPFLETWTLEKLPGAATGAQRSFDKFPPPDEYAALAADFARLGARPI